MKKNLKRGKDAEYNNIDRGVFSLNFSNCQLDKQMYCFNTNCKR